jgi:hypothetical protein
VTDVGVCLTSLTGRTLEPGESQSQNISLFEGLPGMSPLVAGTYVFQQPFSYTGADGRGIHALSLAITYTITEDGKSPAGCPDAASREAVQLPGGAPFLNATKFGSIAEAQAASERALSLPRPNDPLASDEQVSDVWVAQMAGQPQIRIDYASCIYVEIEVARSELAASKGAAAKLYRRMAAEDAPSTDGKSRAIEVLGVPAYLIPTDSAVFANGQSQHAGGSIELIVDGQTVDIVGHVSNEALFRLASSVITNGS